jgi:molybdate transport system substrate-binding protein
MARRPKSGWQLIPVLACCVSGSAQAESATAAVAANFAQPMREIAALFEADTGHELILVFGSTGQLYAQIVNSAPFDVMLAADQDRPERLVAQGLADGSTRFTYAIGQLVLWTANYELAANLDLELLASQRFRRLAIANPATAPYGRAAKEVLESLSLWERLSTRTAIGQSIGQTYAMVATGNAELGFVALSQVIQDAGSGRGLRVPSTLHAPIRQDAVLLRRSENNEAAYALLEYLQSPQARGLIERYGYETAEPRDTSSP